MTTDAQPGAAADAPPAPDAKPPTRGAVERGKLARRAGIVGLGTLLSRILGLGRDISLAAIFTRDETDAFFVAFTLPNMLRQILGEGAVSSAVVPVLSSTLEKEGDAEARAFFARMRGLSLVALLVATALGMTFARPLCELFASGYHAREGEFERTVALTRVVFPYIFFMGSAALGMAALNAKKRFAVAAFAPGLLNVALVVATFTLPAVLAARGIDRVQALAIGALVGGVLQVVAQWPALREIGYFVRPVLDLSDRRVKDALRRLGPVALGIGIYYVDLAISRRFLSELGTGAQSYFTWAMRLCDFPQGIFVMALSTAALPSLSSLAAKGEIGEVVHTFAHGLRLAFFVAVPASVAMVMLGPAVVSAIFEHGAFDALSTQETARALAWQGGAIWTVSAVRQTVPVFHAMGDTRTPVLVSGLDLLAFIALAVGLRGPMGHVGVSVAVAGSSAVQMLLLFVLLRRKVGHIRGRELFGSLARTTGAALVGGIAGWSVARLLTPAPGAAALARALPGVLGGVVFVAIFLLAAYGAGAPELEILAQAVRRKARGAKK
jgi:putative peptidoglycan lipid II flippase